MDTNTLGQKVTEKWNKLEVVSRRFSEILLPLGFLGLIGTAFLACLMGFTSPNFWWQLGEGGRLLQHGQWLTQPLNAFGFPQHPFPQDIAFYEVVLAFLQQHIGFGGLRWFFIVLAFFPFVFGFWVVRSKGMINEVTFLYFTCALVCLVPALQMEPSLAANVALVSLGWFLLSGESSRLLFHFFVPFLCMLFWANTHVSFAMGWFMAACFWGTKWALAFESFEKEWKETWPRALCQAGGLLLGTLLTTRGIYRFADPFVSVSTHWAHIFSPTLWPLGKGWWLMFGFCAAWAAASFWFRLVPKKHVWLLPVILLACLLPLKAQSHLHLLGGVMLVGGLAAALGDPERIKRLPATPFFVLAMLVCVPLVFSVFSTFASRLGGPAFNPPDTLPMASNTLARLSSTVKQPEAFLSAPEVGSYANGKFSNLRPLLDSGFHRFSPNTVRYAHYINSHPEALKLALSQLRVNYVVISQSNAHWIFVLDQLPDWNLLLTEDDGIVYVRRSESDKEVVKTLPPERWFHPLARLAASEDKLVRLRDIIVVHWMSPQALPFALDWIGRFSKRKRAKLLKRMTRSEDPNVHNTPLRVLLAYSLGDYQQTLWHAKKLVDYLGAFADEDLGLFLAQFFLDSNYPEMAKKSFALYCRAPVPSMMHYELQARLGDFTVPRANYWNKKTRRWMERYSRKLNKRIRRGVASP
ncbi:MAG: hypothetical protein V1746_01275 [bacterium]